MAIYFYYNTTASDGQMKRARDLLVGLGYYEHPTISDTYLRNKTIISLGNDQRLVQLNFNDDDRIRTYRQQCQQILDSFRTIFSVTAYATDCGKREEILKRGLNLEGLVKKK